MSDFKRLKYWFPLTVAVALACGILAGWFLRGIDTSRGAKQKFAEILELINDNYVDTVNIDSLLEESIPALLQNLDPHSAYIPAEKLPDANMLLKGSFGGIGIQFTIYRDTINVVELIEDGPSEKAGLLPGDRIVAVDGKPLWGDTLTDETVRNHLRGQIGTNVAVTVVRPGKSGKPLKFNLTRSAIPVNSIEAEYMIDSHTGYVKISSFGENTYLDFVEALTRLGAKGATDYVLDLRGNTGGYMEVAILMANEFLAEDKEIVSTRGRDRSQETVRADGRGIFQDARLAVLIDELSASSSEILAGALQDNDRALIIGRRSFGKGLVQKPFEFRDGSELRLTVQRYYTPSGRSIQKIYKPGAREDYDDEIFERFRRGENLNADSIKLDKSLIYKTVSGRKVYGGGGIMPDIFVPNDTSGITNYYADVYNAGLLTKFAYEYCDLNRAELSRATSLKQLERMLPSDDTLLSSFVHYATAEGIPARWYYIKLSRKLIVNQLKALIARNTLGFAAYYQVINGDDTSVKRAIQAIGKGEANVPIK